jgi:hypothetical protein
MITALLAVAGGVVEAGRPVGHARGRRPPTGLLNNPFNQSINHNLFFSSPSLTAERSSPMSTFTLRRRLAAAFPGAFLLQKRCRCVLLVHGPGRPMDEVTVVSCPRCRRYAWYQAKTKIGTA